MRSVYDIPSLHDLPVMVRASLNVPIQDGKVVNLYRLKKALPTIEYLRSEGAKVVLIGHLGEKGTETLRPVYEAMKVLVPGLLFCEATTGKVAREAVRSLHAGGVVMLENLRRDIGETKNSKEFAEALSELADVFVQDSFDVCHRTHASVVGVPELLAPYAGLQVLEEVTQLGKALKPKSPSLAIIGGAKFSTKEPVLERLLEVYDQVFVGGALANDFMRANGYSIGKSLTSVDADVLAIRTLLKNPRLILPLDEVVAPPGSGSDKGTIVALNAVPDTESILDDGPRTVEYLARLSAKANTILWNGPLGNYEKGFVDSTEGLARAVAQSKAFSILGGGDTVAAVEKLRLQDSFSFISTGGGAMLDFLAKGTLPGLKALER